MDRRREVLVVRVLACSCCVRDTSVSFKNSHSQWPRLKTSAKSIYSFISSFMLKMFSTLIIYVAYRHRLDDYKYMSVDRALISVVLMTISLKKISRFRRFEKAINVTRLFDTFFSGKRIRWTRMERMAVPHTLWGLSCHGMLSLRPRFSRWSYLIF